MMTTAQHPGLVLADKLAALGVLPTELARQLRVPANRITQIINGKRGITGDSALRLAHWFGESPEFWMSLQAKHDLREAALEAGKEIRMLPRRPSNTVPRAIKHQREA
jgi:antitoxin HigA-1